MKVAIFDFDGTLFPVETIPFLIKQYPKLGYSRLKQVKMFLGLIPELLAYKLSRKADKEKFRHRAVYLFLSMFDGMTEDEVDEFFLKNVTRVQELLDPEVLSEVKRCQDEGYHTVLLSGCFDMLLKPLGAYYHFDEVIGTSLIFQPLEDGQPRMSSKVPIAIISGDQKVSAAKTIGQGAEVDWGASIAYADSYYDAPVLGLVGHKVAVNPDQRLRTIAQERDWQLLITTHGQAKVNYSD